VVTVRLPGALATATRVFAASGPSRTIQTNPPGTTRSDVWTSKPVLTPLVNDDWLAEAVVDARDDHEDIHTSMLADAAGLVLFDDREQADDETTRPA
jgi:hypothetical protein